LGFAPESLLYTFFQYSGLPFNTLPFFSKGLQMYGNQQTKQKRFQEKSRKR
jgi:hypothetical protein